MRFLEPPNLPNQHRSPSTSNFIMEEDTRSDISDLPSTNNSNRSFKLLRIPHKITYTLMCSLLFLLVAVAGTFAFLYFNGEATFVLCKTRQCTRTATLLLRTMDETIDPCEDFHKFACGNWISDTAAVVSVPVYDHTTIMRDRIVGRLRTLTENITNGDIEALQQVKILYNTCVDLVAIESAGLEPLKKLLESLIREDWSLAKTLAKIHRKSDQDYLFDMSISPSFKDTSVHSIEIDQPQLPLQKATFLYSRDIVEAYQTLIFSIFSKLDIPNAKNNSAIVVKLEETLARAMSDEEDRNKASMSNLLTLRQLNRIFSSGDEFGPNNSSQTSLTLNWVEYVSTLFEGYGQPDGDTSESMLGDFLVNVNDLAYMHKLSKVLKTIKPEHIKVYLTWQLLYTFGKDVTKDFRDIFATFTSVSEGTDSTPNRHTECILLLDQSLPFALTHKYVVKYVKDDVLEEARLMFKNILHAFKAQLQTLTWMDDETRLRALEKANKVAGYIGYPRWLRSPEKVDAYYAGLKFDYNSFFTNIVRMMSWIAEREIKTFFLPVDRSWTEDSPAEADAWMDDERNAVTFPAGFLQEPFIGMGLKALDYGALGSVVGHELTHGFDTMGRFSDGYGRLSSWWSLDTLNYFVDKTECFVRQYNSYWIPQLSPIKGPNNTVNGKRTLAENIADNGGVREAFEAYRYFVNQFRRGELEPRLPGLEKYNPEMLFFLSFAQSWCSYLSPAALTDLVETNVHSPPQFRIIGPLSNYKEFSRVWNCPSDSRMNPDNKCVLWG